MRYKIWSGAFLLLVVGFFLGWSFAPVSRTVPSAAGNANASPAAEQPKTVSVMLDFGDGTVRTFQDVDMTTAKNVFETMKTLSERGDGFVFQYQPPGQYGIMIEQIGDKKGGDEGKYWMFWVNNAAAEQSADNTPVHPGDVIEWKFINLKVEA